MRITESEFRSLQADLSVKKLSSIVETFKFKQFDSPRRIHLSMLGIDICQVFQIHIALDHQVSASLKEIGH